MYIRFEVTSSTQVRNLNLQIENWSSKYSARHAKKVVKNSLRLTFSDHQHYSLFGITWTGQRFEFMNIDVY